MNLKIHLSQINPTVGDLDGNVRKILDEIKSANISGCDLVVFSEMVVCGYPCEDLWQKKYFISEIEEKVFEICEATKGLKCAVLLGAPTIDEERKKEVIRNSAILIGDGKIKKVVHKKTLPNFSVFDERRHFAPASALSTVEFRGLTLAILICEDLWDLKNLYLLQEQILDAVIAINASPYATNKSQKREEISATFAKNLGKPLVYVNQVGGQDSLVFDGASFVMNPGGEVVLRLRSFEEDFAEVEIKKDGEVLATNSSFAESAAEQDYKACVLGLRDYIYKNGFTKVLLGMSGGIDSALVATIAVDALGAKNVALFALPSRFNSEASMIDAKECAKNLDVNLEIISIETTFEAMLSTLGEVSNLTQENLQSRIRGNILMALSNNSGALLLSTGNKSELACGYSTIYGDMCGAFNPIKDLYKTRVFELAKFRSDVIPKNILTKAPSAELRHNQKDSDSLPDYEILDKILFALIEEEKSVAQVIAAGFESDLVKKVAKLFYASEYKRAQSCLGVKISEMAFDKERRYPITNKFTK